MGPATTLNQGENLNEPQEAGIADRSRRMQGIAHLVVLLATTTDRREDLPKTPEACTGGLCRQAKSSVGMTRHSGQEPLGRDPRGHTEIPEIQEDKEIDRGTLTIAIGIY